MSSGAAMDISMVTRFARTMVVEWGMSERLGFVRYAGEDTRESFLPDREYSDETAALIDEEVRRLVDEAFADAQRMLDQQWDKVEAVANALLKFETLSGDEVHRLMQGGDLNRPSVSDLLKAEARRRSEALVQPPRSAGDSPELPPGAMPTPA
jgi:cell division protease FtsH